MPMLGYDYAIVRVLPRVERGEQINAGVILSCAATGYLRARFELDETLLGRMAPGVELAPIRAALAGIEAVCAGGPAAGALGTMPARSRFHWLVAPRSTVVQVSAVHTGRCRDLDAALDDLLRRMVRR
ncbi:MAG TPA: DUF3037 domain-containing protein [Rubrivivax sp.]|nr:DUF3037 domain-containing protein [Rubrivivax sp.]HPO19998.1 DUF3037 domain-containing protein [Rubrivivax sp.]